MKLPFPTPGTSWRGPFEHRFFLVLTSCSFCFNTQPKLVLKCLWRKIGGNSSIVRGQSSTIKPGIWNHGFIGRKRVTVPYLCLKKIDLIINVCREDNGTPLQYSCLESPMDGGAWWAAVHGVAQSRTRLKPLSSSSSSNQCMQCQRDT